MAAKKQRLADAIADLPAKTPVTWFSRLPDNLQREMLEIRDRFNRGKYPQSFPAIYRYLKSEIPGLPGIETLRRWLTR